MEGAKKGGRFWRVLLVVSGVAGLVWALRERLISIEVPREAKPPTFRRVGADSEVAQPEN